jgi:hypothetical protein
MLSYHVIISCYQNTGAKHKFFFERLAAKSLSKLLFHAQILSLIFFQFKDKSDQSVYSEENSVCGQIIVSGLVSSRTFDFCV